MILDPRGTTRGRLRTGGRIRRPRFSGHSAPGFRSPLRDARSRVKFPGPHHARVSGFRSCGTPRCTLPGEVHPARIMHASSGSGHAAPPASRGSVSPPPGHHDQHPGPIQVTRNFRCSTMLIMSRRIRRLTDLPRHGANRDARLARLLSTTNRTHTQCRPSPSAGARCQVPGARCPVHQQPATSNQQQHQNQHQHQHQHQPPAPARGSGPDKPCDTLDVLGLRKSIERPQGVQPVARFASAAVSRPSAAGSQAT